MQRLEIDGLICRVAAGRTSGPRRHAASTPPPMRQTCAGGTWDTGGASAPAEAKLCAKASCASACILVLRGCMCLLSLIAPCQVCTVALKAGLSTYKTLAGRRGIASARASLPLFPAPEASRSASPLRIDKEALSNIRGNLSFHRLAWYHALIGE